jgi:uncharacterized spore protein YtfJ
MDVAIDADENLYVADTGNGVIRRIDRAHDNNVSTLILTAAAGGGAAPRPPGDAPGGGGGGGAVSCWLPLAMLLLAGARLIRRR